MAKVKKLLDKKDNNENNKKSFFEIIGEMFKLKTSRLLVLGFLTIIIVGALILMSPMCLEDGVSLNLLDALFVATSAISTSGLSTVPITETFNPIGYFVLMCIIEVGGVGFMIFICWAYKNIGKKLPLKSKIAFEQSFEFDTKDVSSMISHIISFMFTSELIGMFIMAFRFVPDFGFGRGLFYSAFHSVSAFCNAGFSLFSDNLMGYQTSLLINLPIMLLVFIGGIGYPVVFDVCKKIKYTIFNGFSFKKLFRKFNLQTKIALVTSGCLIVLGTLFIFIFESFNEATMGDLNVWERLLTSLFQSVNSRSTGFNTLDIPSFREATSVIFIILMFIGSGPASTGGGIRVVPFAILCHTAWSMINNEDKTIMYGRHVHGETVRKSMVVFFIALLLCLISSVGILLSMDCSFLEALFESVSAFSTTGASLGITTSLNWIGKIIITIMMYVGRVGIITVLMSISADVESKYSQGMSFPSEKLILG